MKIYFCGSIAGGRADLATYQNMVDFIKQKKHVVLTEHIVLPDVLLYEKEFTPEQIYTRDIEWLRSCDAVIAEVSHPSHGVGYEVSYALRLGKPVLCLFRDGLFISRLLLGNTSPYIRIKSYQDSDAWQKEIEHFLHHIFHQT